MKAETKLIKTKLGLLQLAEKLGNVSQESYETVAKALQLYIDHPELLHQHRFNSWKLGIDKLNWENEQSIFIGHAIYALKSD